MNKTVFALYNPALLPPDVLLGEFTARRDLLQTLLEIVRGNTRGKPPQHVILTGARGTGKTTTLWAVAHSVARDSELAKLWQPVVFDEESRRVGDLADFWLESIRQWEFATHSCAGIAEQLLAEKHQDLEVQARKAFLSCVDRSGKRALLCIDNLNEIFASIHDPEPLHRLRAFLMADDRVMFLGTATRLFDAVTGLDEPFFDFFRRFELTPLSLDEMKIALLAIADQRGDAHVRETIEKRSGTIRTLHVLTGGNPRLVKTFYRLLAEGLRGDVRQDLERLIDEFTPYFKAILDALPVQQQRIVDAVALAWEPVEVASIAQVTRLPSNHVSAQLRSLVRSGIMCETAGSPKKKTYLLTDRFSNIHYLMRHGRAARRRFDWFVLTLRALFPDPEQADAFAQVAARTASAGEDGLRDTRDFLSCALAYANDERSRLDILHATFKETWDQETHDHLRQWLDIDLAKLHIPSAAGELDIMAFFARMPRELRTKTGYQPDSAKWWFGLTNVLQENGEMQLTEIAYKKTIELSPDSVLPWVYFGSFLCHRLGRLTEAEAACRKAIEIDQDVAFAWITLGAVLEKDPERFDEAEKAMRRAVQSDSDYAYAWCSLGSLLAPKPECYQEAECAFRKAVEIEPNDPYYWCVLGNLLSRDPARHSEAEQAYRTSIKCDATYSYGYFCLAGFLSNKTEGLEEAMKISAKGLIIDPNDTAIRYQFMVVCAGNASSWLEVLPVIAEWCSAHPANSQVFDFTVEGFVRFAQLSSPEEAGKILDGISDPLPFETLRDAFLAHADHEHLNRLAPERRVAVLEVMNRIAKKERGQKDSTKKKRSPK